MRQRRKTNCVVAASEDPPDTPGASTRGNYGRPATARVVAGSLENAPLASDAGSIARRASAFATSRDGHRPRLKGLPRDAPAPQPKASGWHAADWACELGGTAFQLFFGFSVVALLESDRSPIKADVPQPWLRLVLIGVAFGLLAAAVALSPLGRRSGAHLNPAVTLGFFLRAHTPGRDLIGYGVAQVAGAAAAAWAFSVTWGSWARSVNSARTAPEVGLPTWAVVGIEAGLTLGLLLTVLLMVSSAHTARWTPVAVTGALAGLIWAGAPHTGASMNPARTLGPDLVSGKFPALWTYLIGPPLGAVLAVVVFDLLLDRQTLTAKVFHDPAYPSVHATALPAKPHRSSDQMNGRDAGGQRTFRGAGPAECNDAEPTPR